MSKEKINVLVVEDPPENGFRPAVSFLFRSVANTSGARSVGVILTGMGRDGAEELKLLKDKGAVTIAQDADTSVVHGMPGEAIQLGAALYALPPEQIAAMLVTVVTRWVDTAEKAMAEIRQHQYDLLLLDYQLPGASGLDLLAQLHRLPHSQPPADPARPASCRRRLPPSNSCPTPTRPATHSRRHAKQPAN